MTNSDTKDIVFFLTPDGTKVSNDPRFDQEEMLEEVLNSRPNRGDMGIPEPEQKAQTQVEKVASINSTQPGVGENATVEDPVRDAHGPLGTPAQQIQKDDVKQAKEDGADPFNTSTDDDEPVDSNEKVLEVRKEVEEAREALQKSAAALGDDEEGDPDEPKSEWSAKQLKHELAKRNLARQEAGEEPLSTQGVKKKSDLAALLDQDDQDQAGDQS